MHMNPVIILLLRTQSATARLQPREHQQLYFVFVRKSWMNMNDNLRNKVAGELQVQVPYTFTFFRKTKIPGPTSSSYHSKYGLIVVHTTLN